ncbi:Zn(II)2Cys6 transcription factor [Aspergillus ruber CBS 135680]|uniref:Zn(II)2Cys6 transcription factor n=1 Tax=Aspergillus ruber (strain CBS 135680) TaxID=1388766 RepID=A0A017S286_ASPRC|nr:Zn(II)2Cys6 transcription factor [Aspergillus ruber CBS 135680]EYE90290.1 Zn(II)2Cys6 transcription factor [Aspergillus ruber CBS 135680]
MSQSPKSSLPKRCRIACTACRQQKAKCDASLNPDKPCSRCAKVKAECVIHDSFKRENKRQRLSELENETYDLRKRLRASAPAESPTPIAMLTAAAEMGAHSDNSNGRELQAHSTPATTISAYSQSLLSSSCTPQVDVVSDRRIADLTIPRTLENVTLSGKEIDELFQLFFTQYAQFLPILDPRTTPNAYYAQSSFLFWAIIGVACRTYPRNPTLVTALSRSVTNMVLLSASSTSAPWHTIQALFLVLTWPFPKDMTRPDLTFPMSGMLLHIAMQNGLHIPMSSHEFSNVKIPALSEVDMTRRSELWAHCVIVYQRACITKGQSPRTLVSFEQDPGQSQVFLQRIAPTLVLKVRCHEAVARCSAAVLENGVRNMSPDQERALDILIRNFEGQIYDLDTQASSDDKFHTMLARLSVQAFHLFKGQTILTTGCLPRLLSTCCAMIDCIQDVGQKITNLAIVPVQVSFAMLLASVTILRILKSTTFSRELDVERAKSSFFTAINLAKQMTIDSSDMASKSVIILNQLWNSTKAFRKPDGSEYTALRIRSRLVLSPILDAVWWWRDEFDAQYRAMVFPQEASEGVDTQVSSAATSHAWIGPVDRQDSLCLDDQFLADFEWALGDGGLFPPTEPYCQTWSSFGPIL